MNIEFHVGSLSDRVTVSAVDKDEVPPFVVGEALLCYETNAKSTTGFVRGVLVNDNYLDWRDASGHTIAEGLVLALILENLARDNRGGVIYGGHLDLSDYHHPPEEPKKIETATPK